MRSESEPDRFGPYVVHERVATGGMAEIFRAAFLGDKDPDQRYALKRIRPDCDEDVEFRRMLMDEAKIASALKHPNIARVLDVVEHDGQLGLIMEYVDGIDLGRLKRHLKGDALDLELIVHIIQQVLVALDYAHGAKDECGNYLQVVHRDVSPGNVMIDVDGEVRLVDFGIARAQNRLAQTEAGNVKGKFRYMAPEQIKGDGTGPGADVYSTAVVLWELLAGRRIYDELSVAQMMINVANGDIPSLAEAQADLPDSLHRVFRKATEPRPEDRYASARAFADALDSVLLSYDAQACRKELSELVIQAHTKDSRRNFDRAVERARVVAAEHDLEDAILNALERPDRVERVDTDAAIAAEVPGRAGEKRKKPSGLKPADVAQLDEPPTMPMATPVLGASESSLA